MNYRQFGNCGFEASILGFGCMRFPVINKDPKNIDEEKAIEMLRYAIDNGVNYIDTAYPYHGQASEIFVGKALKDGYREKVKLATKLPIWLVKTPEDCDRFLDEQLKKLDTEYVDLYLVHALDKERFKKVKELGIWDFMCRAKASGKIKNIGFSFHDDVKTFKEIIDTYDWDFCQIQYNYMDINSQAGDEGLAYAASKGVPVVVMEPLRGGKLAKNPPDEVMHELQETGMTPAELALRWVWNHPEVKVVLSGMGAMEQVKENLKTADKAYANSLTPKELKVVSNIRSSYNNRTKVGCTGCNYCMPCPAGVDIPENFSAYNEASVYDELDSMKKYYNRMDVKNRASACVKCGRCEKLCPQGIEIRKKLEELNTVFAAE
jgi:predicted aldo/keto reductase-like oxidoreductase